jgi:hypothetical protein
MVDLGERELQFGGDGRCADGGSESDFPDIPEQGSIGYVLTSLRALFDTNFPDAASERLLKKVEDLGCKAIMFTVDAPVSGNRTMDIRAKGVVEQVCRIP